MSILLKIIFAIALFWAIMLTKSIMRFGIKVAAKDAVATTIILWVISGLCFYFGWLS